MFSLTSWPKDGFADGFPGVASFTGMPRVGQSSKGDHYVQFYVNFPKMISDRQRELMLAFALEGEEGREGTIGATDFA